MDLAFLSCPARSNLDLVWSLQQATTLTRKSSDESNGLRKYRVSACDPTGSFGSFFALQHLHRRRPSSVRCGAGKTSECTSFQNLTSVIRNRNDMIMPAASPSRASSSDGDAQEIRQHAYDLLNRMGGPAEDVEDKEWPQSPGENKQPFRYSSYQQQPQVEASRAKFSSPSISNARTSASSSSSSFTEVFVHCVSDACKMATSDVLKTGYDSFKSAVLPEAEDRYFAARSQRTYAPVSGTFQAVDIPQGYRGRYSDNPGADRR